MISPVKIIDENQMDFYTLIYVSVFGLPFTAYGFQLTVFGLLLCGN